MPSIVSHTKDDYKKYINIYNYDVQQNQEPLDAEDYRIRGITQSKVIMPLKCKWSL